MEPAAIAWFALGWCVLVWVYLVAQEPSPAALITEAVLMAPPPATAKQKIVTIADGELHPGWETLTGD
jgi:hypothetical protein